MSNHLSIEEIDPTGGIREIADDAGALKTGSSRRDVLRKAGLAGAGFAAGGFMFNGLMSPAMAQSGWSKTKSAANDAKIGNYALTLEYLEAAFYAQAVAGGALTDPDILEFATVVAKHEQDHVDALKSVLGDAAVASPSVDFGTAVTDQWTFMKVAATLEPVGTAAYAGAGPYIQTPAIVKAALSIHSVEARHAAWVFALSKYKFGGLESPAPNSFDPAYSQAGTLKLVTGTGFIKS